MSERTASFRGSNRHRNRNPMLRSEGHRVSVIAATPAVVPIPRTSFWASVIASGDGASAPAPGMNANVRKVAVTTRLLRIGANMGAAKRRWALSRPVATAPRPYRTICGMKNCRNSVASSCTASRSGLGTRTVYRRTTQGAAMMPTITTSSNTTRAVVRTARAASQASSRDRVLSWRTNTGTNTEVRTPPRTSS